MIPIKAITIQGSYVATCARRKTARSGADQEGAADPVTTMPLTQADAAIARSRAASGRPRVRRRKGIVVAAVPLGARTVRASELYPETGASSSRRRRSSNLTACIMHGVFLDVRLLGHEDFRVDIRSKTPSPARDAGYAIAPKIAVGDRE